MNNVGVPDPANVQQFLADVEAWGKEHLKQVAESLRARGVSLISPEGKAVMREALGQRTIGTIVVSIHSSSIEERAGA